MINTIKNNLKTAGIILVQTVIVVAMIYLVAYMHVACLNDVTLTEFMTTAKDWCLNPFMGF